MLRGKLPKENAFDEMAALPGARDQIFEFTAADPVTASPYAKNEDWYFYVNGYKDAADFLAAHVATEGNPRKLGYPILFLYRHHLELAIKKLIRDCYTLLGHDQAIPAIHAIDKLWQLCCSLLQEISPGIPKNEEIQQTTRLVTDLCKVDPKSEAFRYPEDKSGNAPRLDVAFDIGTVGVVVGKISLLLDCIGADIHTRRYDAS